MSEPQYAQYVPVERSSSIAYQLSSLREIVRSSRHYCACCASSCTACEPADIDRTEEQKAPTNLLYDRIILKNTAFPTLLDVVLITVLCPSGASCLWWMIHIACLCCRRNPSPTTKKLRPSRPRFKRLSRASLSW